MSKFQPLTGKALLKLKSLGNLSGFAKLNSLFVVNVFIYGLEINVISTLFKSVVLFLMTHTHFLYLCIRTCFGLLSSAYMFSASLIIKNLMTLSSSARIVSQTKSTIILETWVEEPTNPLTLWAIWAYTNSI